MKGCDKHDDQPSIVCGDCGAIAAKEAAIAREDILQFFEFAHLPEPLQLVSKEFHAIAYKIVASLPRNPERSVALRKLLESKDAAVRAAIAKR